MNFEDFNKSLDESLDVLEISGTLENVGFTKDQARMVNLLIVKALEKYDALLHKTE